MKCPQKNKHCVCQQVFAAEKKNFLCVGLNKKPKFKCDSIKLCGRGMASQFEFEMTPEEALIIINLLSTGVHNVIQENFNDK